MEQTNKKTFKDFIMEDLDVFFNLDEMAEEHELEGETIAMVIVDSVVNSDRKGVNNQHLYASQEVYKKFKTLYIKSSDFHVPEVDSELELDGKLYYVEDAGEEQGVIRIVISANES